MKEELSKSLLKAKDFWTKQPKKKKVMFGSIAAGVLLFAILGAVLLNAPKMGYKVLFPGMDSSESAQVYATLQEMEIQPEINNKGEIMVPADKWDTLVFQLAGKGYPKSTLNYDTFLNNSGFVTTDFEKRQALLFQLQDRMQQTLIRQEGIADAAVTFTIPETSNYIWDQNNQEESTAAITVTMKPGYELTSDRVTAIKNLAAFSVPKMKPANVVVVDAATGIEVTGNDDGETGGFYSDKRIDFERKLQKAIEDDIKRLLTPVYGPGVTAVATVKLDYDKMMTETKEYKPGDNGAGVVNHFDEQYTLNGNVPAQGIVGEQDNTDVPVYPAQEGDGETATTDYGKNVNYDVSYVLTQIEKGAPILTKSSVAVVVNDQSFDAGREESLKDLISKAVGVLPENISVSNMNFIDKPADQNGGNGVPPMFTTKQLLLIGIGGLLAVILLVILIATLLKKAGRKKKDEERVALVEAEEQRQQELEREIAEHKRMLQEEAKASANPKENAITEEVRDFAKDNPEITAALIRSLIREDK